MKLKLKTWRMIVVGVMLGTCAFALFVSTKHPVREGATLETVSGFLSSARAHANSRLPLSRHVRGQEAMTLLWTPDSRGQMAQNVGRLYFYTDYSLWRHHFATRFVDIDFGVTNGTVGLVTHVTSKWKWSWD